MSYTTRSTSGTSLMMRMARRAARIRIPLGAPNLPVCWHFLNSPREPLRPISVQMPTFCRTRLVCAPGWERLGLVGTEREGGGPTAPALCLPPMGAVGPVGAASMRLRAVKSRRVDADSRRSRTRARLRKGSTCVVDCLSC